jgi:hypothetical protein
MEYVTRFKVGKRYKCMEANDWISVGEVVKCLTTNAAGGNPRFIVKWEQCAKESLRNGDVMIVGYDADLRIYHLCLTGGKFIEYKEEVPMKQLTEEEIESLKNDIDNYKRISYADFSALEALGVEVEDYYCPEDDSDWYYHIDYLTFCAVGDEWYLRTGDFVTVHDRDGDEVLAHVLNVRGSSEFFYCERSEEWWSNRYYSSVYVEDLCERWCFDEYESDLYYDEDSDSYYADSDNVPDRDCIPSYHSQSRYWKVPDGITFGVELEVYVEDAQDAYQNRASEIIGERDGSLDRCNGVEFIGPPMLYDDYLKPRNPWKVTLEGIRNAGVPDKQGEGYGIHISVGRAPLSDETQARFILFINNCQEFSEFIAQREQNRWAEYDKKDAEHVMDGVIRSKGSAWGSKYAATHVDERRIEVRIFRSTTNDKEFQKNIDYVASAVEYADTHMLIEDMMSVSNYLAWLNKQEKYEALRAYIGEKGAEFAQSDERRKALADSGFIIEETDNTPTI